MTYSPRYALTWGQLTDRLQHMNISRSRSANDPASPLTPKQVEFFRAILDFWRREGVPPTVRELQKRCAFKSPRSVLQFLDSLEAAGYIARGDGARNIRVLHPPPAEQNPDQTRTTLVPIVGQVAAGLPILAEQNIEDYLPVSRRLARPPHRYFLLRVVGNSMDRAGMNDGDLVLVRQQSSAEAGQNVVALIDDQATIKRLRPGAEAIMLEPQSTNAAHRPIILDAEFQIQGVVIGVVPQDPLPVPAAARKR